MELSVENLCSVLVRSKLLSPDEVKALYQRWKLESKEGRGDAGQFGKWLVAREHLTSHQVAQALQTLLAEPPEATRGKPPASVTERTPEPPPSEPFNFAVVPLTPPGKRAKETPRPTADVELVVVECPVKSPVSGGGRFHLSVRDWLMLSIGAGAVVAMALAGMFVARLGS